MNIQKIIDTVKVSEVTETKINVQERKDCVASRHGGLSASFRMIKL